MTSNNHLVQIEHTLRTYLKPSFLMVDMNQDLVNVVVAHDQFHKYSPSTRVEIVFDLLKKYNNDSLVMYSVVVQTFSSIELERFLECTKTD